MPRCVICDYCSEIDGNDGRSYRWDPDISGDVCNKCHSSYRTALQDFYDADEDGEIDHWVNFEFDELGPDEILEEQGVEEYSGDTDT